MGKTMTAQEAIIDWAERKAYISRAHNDPETSLMLQQTVDLIERQADEIKRLNQLFTSLTPGGSEFVNSPQTCIEWVNERKQGMYDSIVMFSTRCKTLEDEIKRLQAENSALQCCGNCADWRNGNIMQCMITGSVVNSLYKCDQWRRRE